MSIANLNTLSTEYFELKNKPDSEKNISLLIDKEREFETELVITTGLPFNKYDILYLNTDAPIEYTGADDESDLKNQNKYYTFIKYEKCSIVVHRTSETNNIYYIPFHFNTEYLTKVTDNTIIDREMSKYFTLNNLGTWKVPV